MNTEYTFQGIHFEWDSQKASANLQKHGIAFETACEVFHDPFVQVVDEEIVDDEMREAVIGITIDWRLVYVVYVFREETVRIISARLVTKAERNRYEEQ
ncbi:MAG: BrnT family toxin [Anaerolineae bacterium]|nr:BrnT family toxin [Anaerolineae bacterium]